MKKSKRELTSKVGEAWLKSGGPSDKWLCQFMKVSINVTREELPQNLSYFQRELLTRLITCSWQRHSKILTFRREQKVDKKRAELTWSQIKFFYDSISSITKQYKELENPSRWFNADETCLMPDSKSEKVIVTKGCGDPAARGNMSRETMTLLAAVSADGSSLPPFLISKVYTSNSYLLPVRWYLCPSWRKSYADCPDFRLNRE